MSTKSYNKIQLQKNHMPFIFQLYIWNYLLCMYASKIHMLVEKWHHLAKYPRNHVLVENGTISRDIHETTPLTKTH